MWQSRNWHDICVDSSQKRRSVVVVVALLYYSWKKMSAIYFWTFFSFYFQTFRNLSWIFLATSNKKERKLKASKKGVVAVTFGIFVWLSNTVAQGWGGGRGMFKGEVCFVQGSVPGMGNKTLIFIITINFVFVSLFV
jgi:hypothetical protein